MFARFLSSVLGCLCCLALFTGAGCGGGGGSSTGRLRYTTDWTNSFGGTVTGESQRIRLFDLDGHQEASVVVNKPGPSSVTVDLPSLPNGTYRLYVELYSLPNLGGSQTGELESLIDLDGTTPFLSAVGVGVNLVRVTPAAATFPVQTSQQYYAAPYNTAEVATFAEPDGFTWLAFGGHATVDEDGLALGTSEGSGSIRATHVASGAFNSATYTVEPFVTETSKWTVLVFMNAANDLYPFSTLNMNQMESVAQNDDVRFIVQWKQSQSLYPGSSFNGTRRYLVRPDATGAIASDLIQNLGADVDMGRPQTMLDFINWAKTYYPADRYCLVVWNHGNGWRRRPADESWITRAVSYDDETGNAIQIWELAQAIGSNRFEILAWDASLMQMLEVAYEVEDQADYVAGSEESPPGEGYPYDLIFREFRDNPDASTALLAKEFVDGMLAVPGYASRKITQSVIDTSKLDALAVAVSALGTELNANSAALAALIPTVRNQAQSYSPTPSRVYRDLIDVCERIEVGTTIPSVDAACLAAKAAALDAIVWEGHNANSPGSRGIAIDFSSGATFGSSAGDYAQLKFGQLTQWDEWLAVAP